MNKKIFVPLFLAIAISCSGLKYRSQFENDRIGYLSFDTRTLAIEAHCNYSYMKNTMVTRVRIRDSGRVKGYAYERYFEPKPLLKDFRLLIPSDAMDSLKPGVPFTITVDTDDIFPVWYALDFPSKEALPGNKVLKFVFKDVSGERHGKGYPFF